MPAQPEPTPSPALAAVRALRLGWEEQARARRMATAADAVAAAALTPALPTINHPQRPGAREPVSLGPLPAGPDRCPSTCPHCVARDRGGGDGG